MHLLTHKFCAYNCNLNGNKKISSRQKRRLVCFVARVKTYSVIQSAGTTPPSATRFGEFITPLLSLYRTKVVYP